MDAILAVATVVERELVLAASLLFLVFGIDDLVVDAIWILRGLRKRLFGDKVADDDAALAQAQSSAPRFAIFIPAWDEAKIIRSTIERCLKAYSGHSARIIVGCYANDPATIAAVAAVADDRVSIALNHAVGPTTKGDCLNATWRRALEIERSQGVRFDGFVLHDAEDRASAEELALFSRWLDRFALLQLPVVPIRVPGSRWISGHYCDEFAESHRRSMIVRQAIGASMPSAGVGCCIRRDLIDRLAASRNGDPFDPECLTEDYELGLFARAIAMPSAFLRVPAAEGGGVIATHACFPAEIDAAVRQKARWITGIALAGWDRTGWGIGLAENWTRLRDRKAILEAIALLSAYAAIVIHLVLIPVALTTGDYRRETTTGLETLLLVSSAFMIWRLAVRAYCTGRTYGWREGLIAIPRTLTGNWIAILSARRAIWLYCRMQFTGRTIWEKTDHDLPLEAVTPNHG